jgi:23S rRNA (uridine2552-2'-O)-methyltransferase
MRLADAKRDHYRKLARDQGYRSRAAYKLKQINDSYRILKKGHRVADIGSAPGGWLQVAVGAVGNTGRVVGIDLKTVEPVTGAMILQGSIDDPAAVGSLIEALGGRADVILSDLAPNVSGMWEVDHARQMDLTRNALGLARQILSAGGSAVFKVFEGEFLGELKDELKKSFGKVLVSKPQASRQESSEMYMVCLNFRSG